MEIAPTVPAVCAFTVRPSTVIPASGPTVWPIRAEAVSSGRRERRKSVVLPTKASAVVPMRLTAPLTDSWPALDWASAPATVQILKLSSANTARPAAFTVAWLLTAAMVSVVTEL